jgi:hypothetical protein
MTFNTSAVAVCCSGASVRSRVRGLHLLEQPRVLNGDHGLVGEGSHQFNLLLREWLHGIAQESNHTQRHAIAQQGNPEHRAIFPYRLVSTIDVFGIG